MCVVCQWRRVGDIVEQCAESAVALVGQMNGTTDAPPMGQLCTPGTGGASWWDDWRGVLAAADGDGEVAAAFQAFVVDRLTAVGNAIDRIDEAIVATDAAGAALVRGDDSMAQAIFQQADSALSQPVGTGLS